MKVSTKPLVPGLLIAAALVADPALAQTPDASRLTLGDTAVSGSLRSRVESWDWFRGDADHDYTYLGSLLRLALSRSKRSYDWHLEVAVPVLLGLPDDALAPGAQGQLGLGASYFAANDRATRAVSLFVKQAFVRLKRLGGGGRQSFTIGRIEVVDGTETTPGNATLAALKRDRIAHRLIGNFGFSHVGRSFDGAGYAVNGPALNLTLFGGRPTQGVFQTDGWGELRTNVFYGALTGRVAATKGAGDWRIFGLGFHDRRDNVLKTDSRPLDARREDVEPLTIGTLGGHYLWTGDLPAGTFDGLVWVAVQAGSWGRLSHRAVAAAAEGGFQPSAFAVLKPWIRAGYNRGSGDEDPGDRRHGTFFQVLPTPRVYARFPFFNLMNVEDRFAELIVRPSPRLAIRTDVHALRLAEAGDLWYSGGGPFQPETFGYTGRPSNGHTGLAMLYDVSAEYAPGPHVGLAAYYGHAAGRAVVSRIYPSGGQADFGYLEITCRF